MDYQTAIKIVKSREPLIWAYMFGNGPAALHDDESRAALAFLRHIDRDCRETTNGVRTLELLEGDPVLLPPGLVKLRDDRNAAVDEVESYPRNSPEREKAIERANAAHAKYWDARNNFANRPGGEVERRRLARQLGIDE